VDKSSGFEDLVKGFEGFSRELTGEDEDRKRGDAAEEEFGINGVRVSGGRSERGRVGFEGKDGTFYDGTLLVDVGPMVGAAQDFSGIEAAV